MHTILRSVQRCIHVCMWGGRGGGGERGERGRRAADLFQDEHSVVEQLLELLIGVVDTQLLK